MYYHCASYCHSNDYCQLFFQQLNELFSFQFVLPHYLDNRYFSGKQKGVKTGGGLLHA